jgi:hypothetical protein
MIGQPETGILLTCCLALPVLIIAIGMKFHRVYNRPVAKRKPAR